MQVGRWVCGREQRTLLYITKVKNVVKISIVIFIVTIAAFYFYGNYQSTYSQEAIEGDLNIENMKKVKVGMTSGDVVSIMGQPDMIEPPDSVRDPNTTYVYNTNCESFDCAAVFDSSMKVIKIINYGDGPLAVPLAVASLP